MKRMLHVACFALLFGTVAVRGDSEISWSSFSAGGATASAGRNSIQGTIGQSIGGVANSTHHSISAGFWPGAVARGPCPGDANGDHVVDLADLSALLGHYGVGSGASRADGDLDGDGDVDLADLSALLAHFGGAC